MSVVIDRYRTGFRFRCPMSRQFYGPMFRNLQAIESFFNWYDGDVRYIGSWVSEEKQWNQVLEEWCTHLQQQHDSVKSKQQQDTEKSRSTDNAVATTNHLAVLFGRNDYIMTKQCNNNIGCGGSNEKNHNNKSSSSSSGGRSKHKPVVGLLDLGSRLDHRHSTAAPSTQSQESMPEEDALLLDRGMSHLSITNQAGDNVRSIPIGRSGILRVEKQHTTVVDPVTVAVPVSSKKRLQRADSNSFHRRSLSDGDKTYRSWTSPTPVTDKQLAAVQSPTTGALREQQQQQCEKYPMSDDESCNILIVSNLD